MVLIAMYPWSVLMHVFRISMTKYLQTHLRMLGETLHSFVQPLKFEVCDILLKNVTFFF